MSNLGKIEYILKMIEEGIKDVIVSLGGEVSKECEITGFTVTSASELEKIVDPGYVFFFGKLEDGGGLGLGFNKNFIIYMLKLVAHEVEDIDESSRSSLMELGEAILGGVLGKLSSEAGKGVVQFRKVLVSLNNEEMFQISKECFAKDIGAGSLRISGGNLDGRVIVIVEGSICEWFGVKFEDLRASKTSPKETMTEVEIQSFLQKELQDRKSKDLGIMAVSDEKFKNLGVILGIEVEVVARLGSVEMPLSSVLSLGPGSVVNIGHLVDEPVELYVNNKLIARGDVVIVDEKFGVRITEVVSQEERIESLR
ncbi:MAG: FliM/FliN family flagellar motor switch protein [Candidatus Hydrogenedentes bacterium]|nr:FliM/FliN family flagellar motor switch protein [Candidatus Hydrogenedentota bacterium]